MASKIWPSDCREVEGCASGEDASIHTEYRPMTFQVTMSGADGMVMASDQCEFDGAELSPNGPSVKNLIRKVAISGSFAWAFSEGRLGPFFSPFLQRALDSAGDVSCEVAIQILESCGKPALAEWKEYIATVSCLSWKWRRRSYVKITERTYEEGTVAFHPRRKSSHPEAASCGQGASLGAV